PLESPVRFTLPAPNRDGTQVRGEVLCVDRFGNLVTNLRAEDLPEAAWDLHLGGRTIRGPGLTFSSVPSGELVAYLGSGGFLEVAVRDGNARRSLDADRGSPLLLEVAS
ncbi:MAG: SAM hydroxide adenosyltransferase, partial [Planctomycetota bacterium]